MLADHSTSMKITLELWDDQSDIDDDTETSTWIMKLNGQEFPEGKNCLMSLLVAHKIVVKLLEIEELAADDI
jgi:DNA-directed RNA polymerase specialized sigma24 family protein